eukprot:359167-Chlamydomonas_euryale.AAC.4
MYTPEKEDELLSGRPDYVIDAIDNLDTKVEGTGGVGAGAGAGDGADEAESCTQEGGFLLTRHRGGEGCGKVHQCGGRDDSIYVVTDKFKAHTCQLKGRERQTMCPHSCSALRPPTPAGRAGCSVRAARHQGFGFCRRGCQGGPHPPARGGPERSQH